MTMHFNEKALSQVCFFFCCFLLLPVLILSCNETPPAFIDKEVYIPVKQNSLYLRLAGKATGPVIVMLHGGPGGSSGFDREFYKGPMEGQYLMVYLDQRGSGKSPAEAKDSLLTMGQFVSDLDAVIDSLHNWCPDQPIHLLGSSWGGTYGFLYLLAHQRKIRSFISVSGKIDGRYEHEVLIAHEMALVQSALKATKLPPGSIEKDTLRRIARELKRMRHSSLTHYYEDVELLKHSFPQTLGFNPYWVDSAAHNKVIKLSKDSAFYARAHYEMAGYDSISQKGEHVNRVFRNTPDYNQIQLTNRLDQIRVPVAVIGGAQDYVVGPGHARLIYEALTSLDPDEKELHILPGAAHNVNLEAADRYYPVIKAFLAKHP